MSENVSVKPWELIISEDNDMAYVLDANKDEVMRVGLDDCLIDDIEYIVKAVNEYDSLVAEVSHLKKVNGSLEVDIDQSERRNSELVAEVERLNSLIKTHEDGCKKITNEYYDACRKLGELKQENEQLRTVLNECYDIAYDLMPTDGYDCDAKIFDYAKTLNNISKLISGGGKDVKRP